MYAHHSTTLETGDRAPRFCLKTARGDALSLEDLGGRPAMIVFFRGTW